MNLNKELKLSKIGLHQEVIVSSVDEVDYHNRLVGLGFTIGQKVIIQRKAPFGDTYYIKVGHSLAALRLIEMNAINVTSRQD